MNTTDIDTNVQRGVQQNAPDDAAPDHHGASASTHEISAALIDPVADSIPGSPPKIRRDRGRFVKGNTERLKHGRWSKAAASALLPEQAETLAILNERGAAIFIDLGGESELSVFERDLVRKYGQLDAIAEFNAPRLLASRASVRRDARDTFLSCIDRQLKIIALLGSKRRQRDVGSMSIVEYANQEKEDER